MIRCDKLCLAFGADVIFDDACFTVRDAEKVGIVGVNGAGKTTLFKVLLGITEPDSGTVSCGRARIGYLPQEITIPEDCGTVWDYIYDGRPIRALNAEYEDICEKLASDPPDTDKLLKRMGQVQEELDRLDCYNAEDALLDLIVSSGLPEDWLDKDPHELSGGQRSRIAFLRLLFSDADILLLDEPTNHLDKDTRAFVTDYLRHCHGSVLVISHDADFLNEIADGILFLDKTTHRIVRYEGNYSEFKKKYARDRLLRSLRIEQQEREIKQLAEFVAKARAASRTNHNLKRMGQDREKKLERKLGELEARDKTYKRVKMQFTPRRQSPAVPIEVSDLSFAYPGGEKLYSGLSFSISGGERFLVVGENGAGKSTLLKLLTGRLAPDSGSITVSRYAETAYYAQELELVDVSVDVLENVRTADYTDLALRNVLGNFLFPGDSVFKKASVLSPGEKARVALCKVLLSKANLLLLDEPTNHLDPDTQAVIGDNINDYTGTVIVVSHSPAFVERIGITRMLVLPEGKIMDYSRELLEYYYILSDEFLM